MYQKENISYNYAKSIYNFSIENKKINYWKKKIYYITNILKNKKIISILKNIRNYKTLYNNFILFLKFNKYEINLIKIIIENKNLYIFKNIFKKLKNIINKKNKIYIIKIYTAYKLNKIQEIYIKKKINLFLKKNCKINFKKKKSIISGIIIKLNNNKVIDCSILNKIKELNKNLKK